MNNKLKAKRTPPPTEQILAEQKRMAELDRARAATTLPAKSAATAVAVPDTRTETQKYLDEIAPASIVGRMIKFTKNSEFATSDDNVAITPTLLHSLTRR